MYFQLYPSMRHTGETECGLLLLKTPTRMDGEVSSGKSNPVSGNSGTLAQEIMSGYEPTMKKLGMLPTPRQSEWKGVGPLGSKSQKHMEDKDYLCAIVQAETGQNGLLSPQFVMEMMGYPNDYTELPFLSGETSQSKPEEMP
jgi:hypothetical protein